MTILDVKYSRRETFDNLGVFGCTMRAVDFPTYFIVQDDSLIANETAGTVRLNSL
jgi:hypothetical protein